MLELLSAMGYTKDKIILATQEESDFEEYNKLHCEKATVIFRKGYNISDNKNTILDYVVGELGNPRIVMCSDKVRGVAYLGDDKKLHYVTTKEVMDAIVENAFIITERLGGEVWGVYLVGNTFYMKHTISTNQQILGCFMGIANPSTQRFDTKQPLKEDFEFVLRHVMNRRKTIRFNDMCLKSTLHTKGGCHDAWIDEEINKRCNDRILKMYEGLVRKHPTRQNEQKYIGPSEIYKTSILRQVGLLHD